MRCAIYCRVSTDKQEDRGTSLDTQRDACIEHAERRGWEVARVELETMSGATFKHRPKLMRLLDEARAGRIDVLLAYDLDRLTRGGTSAIGWIEHEMAEAECTIELVRGSDHEIVRVVEGFAAKQERAQIQERTKRARAATITGGRAHVGHANYGYRARREMQGARAIIVGLDPDPLTSPTVQKIFDLLAGGKSMNAVAVILNEAGIPSPRGGKWRNTTISSMLSNPIYMGKQTGLRWVNHKNRDSGKVGPKARPQSEHVDLGDGAAPALVTPEIWHRANAQRVAGQGANVRRAKEPELYLLRGMIVCGYCGRTLNGLRTKRTKDGEPGKPRYVCKKQRVGCGCGVSASINAEDIDGSIWRGVVEVLLDPAWLEEHIHEAADTTDRVAEAQGRLAQLRAQQNRLAAAVAMTDDPTPVIAKMNEVTGQIRAIEVEVSALEDQAAQAAQAGDRLREASRFIRQYERLGELDWEGRRSVLRDLGVKVTLWKRDHDPRWAIEWNATIGGEAIGLPDVDAWDEQLGVSSHGPNFRSERRDSSEGASTLTSNCKCGVTTTGRITARTITSKRRSIHRSR